jgi:hypothetical protein
MGVGIPGWLPPEVQAQIIVRRRARAAQLGHPDPFPDEPKPKTPSKPATKKGRG